MSDSSPARRVIPVAARVALISESRRAYFDQLAERQMPHLERLLAADKRRPEMPSAFSAFVEK